MNATKGARFQFHPGFDLWMRGYRFFTVVKEGRTWIHAKLDNGKRVRISRELFAKCAEVKA